MQLAKSLSGRWKPLSEVVFFSIALLSVAAYAANDHVFRSERAALADAFGTLASEKEAPRIYDMEQRPDGLFQLYLDGPPFKGSSTRFFAIYKLPDTRLESDKVVSGKIPAVVLVHGGGGTAYAEWVRRWNAVGFAAISIAVEGQTDSVADESLQGPDRWARHPFGGPPRKGIYLDWNEATGDEWMFHSVYTTIQANNFLRHQAEIDPANIGIVGISWGGVITATTIGFDKRFAFAVPIYGSGYLPEISNQYGRALANNPEYAAFWEPALRLKNFDGPSLWLTGRAENNFYLPEQAATYRTVGGEASVSIKPKMRHGHGAGWLEPESYAFATAVTRNGESPFVPSEAITTDDGSHVVSFRVSRELSPVSATVFVTSERVITPETNWQEYSADVAIKDDEITFVETTVQSLPEGWAHWFVNLSLLKKESGAMLTASSRLNSLAE